MTRKIYLENPYLKEVHATVTKKEYSNNRFYISLDRTIFYPHMSGGQPRDKGTINGIEVQDVFEDGENIVHVIEDNIVENQVQLSIDWKTRFDHMQQHTGQHLLSAAFYKLYNAETIGFHLGKEFVYIDVTLPKLSISDVEKIERYANEIIFSNFDIKSYNISNDKIGSIPLRKLPTVESDIRIVEIDGIDYSPCGGTHHSSIGEVGLIKIRKWEKYKGNTRVEFVCGGRALKDYSWKNIIVSNISNMLSIKDTDAYEGVLRLYDENKDLGKENGRLREELLKYKALDIYKESFDYKDYKIIAKIFEEEDFKDVKYIGSQAIVGDKTIVFFGVKERDKVQILIGKSKDVPVDMKDLFNSIIPIIDGKGGGSPYLLQGGGPRVDKLEECLETGLNMLRDTL